jgi:hypothetical protein
LKLKNEARAQERAVEPLKKKWRQQSGFLTFLLDNGISANSRNIVFQAKNGKLETVQHMFVFNNSFSKTLLHFSRKFVYDCGLIRGET